MGRTATGGEVGQLCIYKKNESYLNRMAGCYRLLSSPRELPETYRNISRGEVGRYGGTMHPASPCRNIAINDKN